MRRLTLLIATVAALGLMAGPAAAHHLVVDPPGQDDVKVGWVGSGALPGAAQGNGLIPGGPGGIYLQSPSHAKGLTTACESLRRNGNSTVQIFGPPSPAGCAHGT